MAQNMFSPGQTATTESYRDNYERVFKNSKHKPKIGWPELALKKEGTLHERPEDLTSLADPHLNEGRN
jgi:hypothetical protein